MLYDEKYSYLIIDKYEFDSSFLNTRNVKTTKKYVLVFFSQNDEIKCIKLETYNDVKNFGYEVMVKYYIEELNITGDYFESEYSYSVCYNIKGIGYIKKVVPLIESDLIFDNEHLKEILDYYDTNWRLFNIDEWEFFN